MPTVKLSTHVVLQILAMLIQFANQLQLGHLFPPEWTPSIAVLVAILQGLTAAIAQYSNTNGTPQEVPGGKAARQ